MGALIQSRNNRRAKSLFVIGALTMSNLLGVFGIVGAQASTCAAIPFSDGNGTLSAPYEIASVGNLIHLSETAGADSANTGGKHFKLTEDLDLLGCTLAPIGTSAEPFMGTFDGGDLSISNLALNSAEAGAAVGLFGTASSAEIKNLELVSPVVYSVHTAGAVLGSGDATSLYNIKVSTGIIEAKEYVGGIAGALMDGDGKTLSNLSAEGTRVIGHKQVGGLLGNISNYFAPKFLFFEGEIVENGTESATRIGGLIASATSPAGPPSTLSFSSFEGKIYLFTDQTDQQVGGLVAMTSGPNKIENSSAHGAVEAKQGAVLAGLVASPDGLEKISNSYVQMIHYNPTSANNPVSAAPFATDWTGVLESSYFYNWANLFAEPLPQGAKTYSELAQPTTFVGWSMETSADVVRVSTPQNPSAIWLSEPQIRHGLPVLSWAYKAGLAIAPCNYGQYSVDGLLPCIEAPEGYFVAEQGGTTALPCEIGEYQPRSGERDCLPARAGHFVSETGRSADVPCPPGFYQPEMGQTQCDPAEPGSFVASPGQASQTSCEPGTYQPDSNTTSCIDTEPGRYAGAGQTSSTLCAPGSYQPSFRSASCILAEPGYFVADSGALSQTPCPSGRVSSSSRTECELAPSSGGGGFFPAPVTPSDPISSNPLTQTNKLAVLDDKGGVIEVAQELAADKKSISLSFGTAKLSLSSLGATFSDSGKLTAAAGSNLNISATGYQPDTLITGYLVPTSALTTSNFTSANISASNFKTLSTQPILLGTQTVDQDGKFTFDSKLSATSGTYLLQLSGTALGGQKADILLETQIGSSSVAGEHKTWAKRMTGNNQAKLYAKNIIGKGKVSFRVNGKEIAWANATSNSDKKLRIVGEDNYLVRTINLAKGKNVLEIWVDGIRKTRTVYSR